ncbi:MAG: hypothetical protein ACXWKB_08170, partial [Methyloceanibacter sp.]
PLPSGALAAMLPTAPQFSVPYLRHLGGTALGHRFPSPTAVTAMNDCLRSDTAAGIPVLEEKLRDGRSPCPSSIDPFGPRPSCALMKEHECADMSERNVCGPQEHDAQSAGFCRLHVGYRNPRPLESLGQARDAGGVIPLLAFTESGGDLDI